MKKSITTFLGLSLLLCVAACKQSSDSESPPQGGFVIDADVVGTQVFFEDQMLGVTPVRLSKKDLIKFGLAQRDGGNMRLDSDGWGEGLFIGVEDEAENKIHFLAAEPNLYFDAQTPWGRRTRISGGSSNHQDSFKVKLDSRKSEDVKTSIEVVGRTQAGVKIRMTATNTAEQVVEGFRPKVQFQWGTMSTGWRKRTRKTVELPNDWSSLEMGKEHSIEVELPINFAEGGVSLFCTMSLFEGEDGNTLAGKGSVYGDSIWVDSK